MTSDALSTQALNRALLARQRLLARVPLAANGDRAGHVIRVVEHLAGLQAQAPFRRTTACGHGWTGSGRRTWPS